jgi:uncharacterized protein (TIGR03437 family)
MGVSAQSNIGYQISTLAGSDWIGDNGAATLAILTQAEGIAADSAGNLYLADSAQNRIRKITRAGVITTFAGTGIAGFSGDGGPAVSAQFNSPYGLVFDGMGNLFVADLGNARLRMVAANGTVSTVAGGGSLPPGGSNEGSAATMVALAAPRNVALDGLGVLYFSDFTGQRVYRVALGSSGGAGGALTTIAGTGAPGLSGDNGPANRAQLSYPAGLAFDHTGAMYIADSQNHLIRKVAGGIIFSVARAVTPTGLAVDPFGTLYAADPGAGELLTFPANGTAAAFAISALDLTFGPDGYLYASQGSTAIRVSFAGASTVVAGGGSSASGDQGPATNALLQHPSGVAADTLGNIYIADRDNHRIRKVAPDGIITTVAGTGDIGTAPASGYGDGGLATQAQLHAPSSVTVDAKGNLYIADTGHGRVRQVTPAGIIQAVPFPGLISPVYALTDSTGDLYVSDAGLGAIVSITPLGAISSLADQLNSPGGFAFDTGGNLYFTETGAGRVRRRDTAGNLTTVAAGIWNAPHGIAMSAAAQQASAPQNIFVADSGLNRILRIDSSGVVTTIAGTGAPGFSGDDAGAAAAQLNSPSDLAIDSQGVIYTADLNNNRVRRLTPAPNVVAAPLVLVSAVNAASLETGPVAPGMLLDVLDTGLTAADAPNVQVLFQTTSVNSPPVQIPAQILSINSGTVVLVAPPQIAAGNVTLQVLNNNVQIAQITSVVAAAAPGLFTSSGGQALVVNEDGSLNSATNPAARGSIVVLYGTGQGISGLAVSVAVGGYAANVLYSGPVAGYPGLWQLNVQMPAGYVAPGTMAVIVNVGGASSQPGVFLTLN